MWSRIYLIPMLQAEEDRDQVRRYYAQQKMEEELLGKSQSVYNKDVYVNWMRDYVNAILTIHRSYQIRSQEGGMGRQTQPIWKISSKCEENQHCKPRRGGQHHQSHVHTPRL